MVRFLRMLLGVKHFVLDAGPLSNLLSSSDFSMDVVPTSTGWPFSYNIRDFLDHGIVFLAVRAVNLVVVVLATMGRLVGMVTTSSL